MKLTNSKQKKLTSSRHRHYKQSDRKCEMLNDLTLEQSRALMHLPCYWCGKRPENGCGLDRLDSSRGHEIDNIIPSCSRCNFFLTDIPFEAKLELREGLRKIEERKLMDGWVPPPLRKKQTENNISKIQSMSDVSVIQPVTVLSSSTFKPRVMGVWPELQPEEIYKY
jgi:hypothetical protein